jgi:hypothetical protein
MSSLETGMETKPLRQSAFLNWRTTGATGAARALVRQCASAQVLFRGRATGAAQTALLHGLRQSDWRNEPTGRAVSAPFLGENGGGS